jgi:DNA-binding transcriptional MerR regulator
MSEHLPNSELPLIPSKRYFTIGEVGELCGVKPHVLRYWEQEFTQLRPVKRRGNRRYYQHHEVMLIRRIRELLYEQGFTISGARNRLLSEGEVEGISDAMETAEAESLMAEVATLSAQEIKKELSEILDLLQA